MNLKYLPGLNGLRFIAALFVLVSHAYQTAVKVGWIAEIHSTVIIDRGLASVDFFFTLSGFLITYLLIQEYEKTGAISLGHFYLRRVCRIWPLYYLILATGFTLFCVVYPKVYHSTYFEFDVRRGLLFYLLFLPNWMIARYKVGLLFPLWSIGVEEQFYLFWAPLVKWSRNALVRSAVAFAILSVLFHACLQSGWLTRDPDLVRFLNTLKFHYMGVGSVFACLLYYRGAQLQRTFLLSYGSQMLTIAVLLYHYVVGIPVGPIPVLLDLALAFFYAMLILQVSVAPQRLFSLEWRPLVYLGQISYGIYMFHMTVDYLLRTAFLTVGLGNRRSNVLPPLYGALLLGGTICVAHVSYQYLESRFLRFAHRRSYGTGVHDPGAT